MASGTSFQVDKVRVDVFFCAQAIDTLGTVWRSAASGFINKIRHWYEFLSSKTDEKRVQTYDPKDDWKPKLQILHRLAYPMQGLDRLHGGVDLCDSSMSCRVLLDISACITCIVFWFCSEACPLVRHIPEQATMYLEMLRTASNMCKCKLFCTCLYQLVFEAL